MKKIFDQMSELTKREAFLLKKGRYISTDNEEYLDLKNYILSDECLNDIERLRNGDYFLDIPTKSFIKKRNSNKLRTVYIFPDKQKYLLKLMSFCLNCYNRCFSKSLYSFKLNTNHKLFFKKARLIDRRRTHYVVKTDAHAYSDSMNPDILDQYVKEVVGKDEELYSFIHWFIQRKQYYYKGELYNEPFAPSCGVPLSSLFCNSYLMHIDRIFDKKYPLYMRFSDDIAVFTNTEEEAIEVEKRLKEEFQKIDLTCNEDKTYIFKPGEPFSILGFEAGVNEIDIAPSNIKKVINRIDKTERKLLKQRHHNTYTREQCFHYAMKFQRFLLYGSPKFPNSMNWSLWTFATITTDKSLKIVDNRIQNFLRSVYTGKKVKARYRMSYKELKEFGYVTLVNQYHNREKLFEEREKNINPKK